MRRLDRLDSLQVISPCPVDWETMTGNDQVRFQAPPRPPRLVKGEVAIQDYDLSRDEP
jgi:hypothetical protein